MSPLDLGLDKPLVPRYYRPSEKVNCEDVSRMIDAMHLSRKRVQSMLDGMNKISDINSQFADDDDDGDNDECEKLMSCPPLNAA